jgi:hypothetical protein
MLTDIIAVDLDSNKAAIADLAFRRHGEMTWPGITKAKYYPAAGQRS